MSDQIKVNIRISYDNIIEVNDNEFGVKVLSLYYSMPKNVIEENRIETLEQHIKDKETSVSYWVTEHNKKEKQVAELKKQLDELKQKVSEISQ